MNFGLAQAPAELCVPLAVIRKEYRTMSWQEAGIGLTFLLGVWNLVYNYKTAKRTSYINTITTERLRWISALRENISAFCGRTHYWVMAQNDLSAEESNAVIKEIDKLRMLIKLQLNPDASPDKRLLELLDKIPLHTHGSQEEEVKELLAEMVAAAQKLLKKEWEKVKYESEHGGSQSMLA